MVNIYGVDAGEHSRRDWVCYEGNVYSMEYYRAVHIVAARSRGDARAQVARIEGLDYTEPMKIRLLATNVENPAVDDYWMEFGAAFHPDTFDELLWQAALDDERQPDGAS